jgi:acyl carrier protein
LVDVPRDIRRFMREELGRELESVRDEESLLEAGIVDSLGVLALVSFIERQYGIRVTEDEMMPENFDSIAAIAAFVGSRRGQHD